MGANAGIKFVQAHGNTLERARLGAVVWGQVPDEAVVKSLARMQDSDGGFRYSAPTFSPEWDGAYLAWLLRCLYDAGLSRQHPLVDRGLSDLGSKQRPDGSWNPEEGKGEAERVNSTVTALCALARYGELGEC